MIKRRDSRRDAGDAQPEREIPAQGSPDLASDVRSVLHDLSPQQRAILVLRDLEGLSYDEIAEVTDTPVGSVKGRIHRARSELIDLLRNNTYDWELPA